MVLVAALALLASSCGLFGASSGSLGSGGSSGTGAGGTTPTASQACGPGAHAQKPPASGFVGRQGSRLVLDGRTFRFGGANIYWLGLDENVGGVAYPTRFRIDDALETARDMGVTVVRSHTLGISTGNPLSLEPSLGHFNDSAFATIDWAIYEACTLGIHLVIPLTDNWDYYEGGYVDFTNWLGLPKSAFFTSQAAIAAFEQYISVLLDHENPYTGLELRDDPTIMAWELGNELNGMTPTWVRDIASFVHGLAPHQLVMAGQQYGVSAAVLADPYVDIVDAHFYPALLPEIAFDAALSAAAGKVFVAGEYASTSANATLFQGIEDDPEVSGAAFWSLFAHLDTYGYEQHADGYTVHFPGISSAMRERDHLIRAFDYAMSGIPEPPEPPPGQPLVTSLARSGTGGTDSRSAVVLAWRGTTDAATYSVQRSTIGPGGPWSTVCDRCATDDSTPWTDTGAPASALWYRVIPYNEQGVAGTPSPVADIGPTGSTQP